MFIIFYGSGNILMFLAAIMLLGSIVFSVWHTITEAKENGTKTMCKDLSPLKKTGLLINTLCIFASISAVAYGFVQSNGVVGTIGILLWIITSVIGAYVCSPLRIITYDLQGKYGLGINFIFVAPVLLVLALVSTILIMCTSWIFSLITLLKGLSAKVYIVISICILLLVGGAVGINCYQYSQDNKIAVQNTETQDQIMEKVRKSIEDGKTHPIIYTEEEQAILKEMDRKPFFTKEIQELIAEKFSTLYKEKNFDGIVHFVEYLDYHNAASSLGKDIIFDADFLTFMREEIWTRSKAPEKEFDKNFVVNEQEYLVKRDYIYFNTGSIILGNNSYRTEYYNTYDETRKEYYLIVGKKVTCEEEKNQNSDYYPAAKCPKCGLSFRENTTYAMSIAKKGYCGKGLCGKN